MSIYDYYLNERELFIEKCTTCGLCASLCPIVGYTDQKDSSPSDIQKGVLNFLKQGITSKEAYIKAFACMECFKCTAEVCPEKLNPMIINEFIKSEYISRDMATNSFNNSMLPESIHRMLSSIMISSEEYTRITSPGSVDQARQVFFPGCNIYLQPEKLLNALDIMDAIGDEYAFLPGLDNCCGDNFLFSGYIEEGCCQAEELVKTLAEYNPETVILWCPTCHCRFEQFFSESMNIPFRVISFTEYLAENMYKLKFKDNSSGIVTLHEACKSAYTGIDLKSPRQILEQLPGISLKEMKHHGKETMCCGSGAISWFGESCEMIRQERLQEAVKTGADKLVTICHYCNQTFASDEPYCDLEITSYVSLVAEAMGIHREDKFKKYLQMGDLDLILKDAKDFIEGSPFEKEQIIGAIQEVFVNENKT